MIKKYLVILVVIVVIVLGVAYLYPVSKTVSITSTFSDPTLGLSLQD
jgi:hypothetical protein